jgi:hypothetical protein
MKYVGKQQHINHLIATIKQYYTFSKHWDGQLYCGIKIKWDYPNRTIDLSMTGYIAATQYKYQHPKAKCPQHAPPLEPRKA